MTRLPSDSFLPSGGLDNEAHLPFAGVHSDSTSSVISPLSLPRGATHYFDPHAAPHPASRTSVNGAFTLPHHAGAVNLTTSTALRNAYSPRTAALRAPPKSQAAPPQFLSPHLTPTSTQIHYQLQQQRRQQRSVSLSPTRRAASLGSAGMARTRSAMASPSRMPSSATMQPLDGTLSDSGLNGLAPSSTLSLGSVSSLGHPRTVSADAISGPSAVTIIQQLKHQNRVIREAWENERKFLEANRSRAEEVYKEERTIMEAERVDWDAERAALLDRIRQLEGTGSKSDRGRLARPSRIEEEGSFSSMEGAYMDGGYNASPESIRGSGSSQGHLAQRNGKVTQKVAFQANVSPPPALGTTRLPPIMHPESAPFTSQSNQPQEDFLAQDTMDSSSNDGSVVPTVDVQEIHPDLEGIPIKSTAITKPTFTDSALSPPGSKLSSGKPSPPTNAARPPELKPMSSSTEQTLQVLAAGADQRLTMYAGHTPSHSLSLFPTRQGTEATTTASSSGESTPIIQVADDDTVTLPPGVLASAERQGVDETSKAVDFAIEDELPEPEHSMLEPTDDVELKGPLMVRNIPAKDEIFFRRLSEKLEDVARDDEAPTVLKKSPLLQAVTVPLQPITVQAILAGPSETGTDGTADKLSDNAPSSGSSPLDQDDEADIPLKLKRSNNFGAPFGAVRQYAF